MPQKRGNKSSRLDDDGDSGELSKFVATLNFNLAAQETRRHRYIIFLIFVAVVDVLCVCDHVRGRSAVTDVAAAVAAAAVAAATRACTVAAAYVPGKIG
jgi:hypothetical protein